MIVNIPKEVSLVDSRTSLPYSIHLSAKRHSKISNVSTLKWTLRILTQYFRLTTSLNMNMMRLSSLSTYQDILIQTQNRVSKAEH